MNKIKNSIRFGLLIASLCCGFLLTSCVIEPQMFGVPQSQWNQLSEEQQQEVIRGYNEKQRIDATNEPINRAIGAAAVVITQDRNLRHPPHHGIR